MRTISILTIALFLGCAASCANSKKANKTEEQVEEKHPETPGISAYPNYAVDYLAAAKDNSWYLSVEFDKQITFYDRNNNLEFNVNESHYEVAAGANVVSIWAEDAHYKIQINIDVVECGEHGRNANIVLQRKRDSQSFDYVGCGQYRGTPQLHDIWAVTEINGEKLKSEQFPREFPHFEFDLAQQKMSGFAGCNHVNGPIYFGYRSMTIEPLISTKMYCMETSKIENQILNILRNKPTYHIKDLHLYIETPDGSITLKKVD